MATIDDIIMELNSDGASDCSVLDVIECLEQARDTISDLEAKVEELEKPVEDEEVKEILRSLRVSWDGFGKTVLKESPAADLIERLVREKAELIAKVEKLTKEAVRLRFLEEVYPESVRHRVGLQDRVEELETDLHYCNGVSDLAIKHRDIAEAKVEELEAVLDRVHYLLTLDTPYINTAIALTDRQGDTRNRGITPPDESLQAKIDELTAELEYWKGRTENGTNAQHWPEFGPSGG